MATENKVVVITGGASGIGLALIRHFMRDHIVVSIDRNPEKRKKLRAALPEVISLSADICHQEEVAAAVCQIKKAFGKINMLIHSAGVGWFYDMSRISEEELFARVETEITTNFTAPVLLTKLCLPLLSRAEDACIIFITTGLAYMPDAASPIYCSSKAGLHFLAMSLRHQLKQTGIRVIEVLPPAVDTEFSREIDVPKISTEKLIKVFIRQMNQGKTTIRIGMVKVLYLLSRVFPGMAFKVINGRT